MIVFVFIFVFVLFYLLNKYRHEIRKTALVRSEPMQKFYGKSRSFYQPYLTRLTGHFDVHHICDGVYLGDIPSAANEKKLKELGITHVLTAVMGVEEMFPGGFVYKLLPLRDISEQNIMDFFDESTKFINDALEKNGKVYVHCMAGVSRSATLVAAWLMTTKNMKPEEAIEFMKSKRAVVNPNPGFRNQLNTYHQSMPALRNMKN